MNTKNKNRGEGEIEVLFFIAMFIVGFILGIKLGSDTTKKRMEYEIIQHKLGSYVVNPTNGEVNFEFITVTNKIF